MPVTTATTTTDGYSQSPCRDGLHVHLKDPKRDGPADLDALDRELSDLIGDLAGARSLLELTAPYTEDPHTGSLEAARGIAHRALSHLGDVQSALVNGQTRGVGCTLEDISLSVMNAAGSVNHVTDTAAPGGPIERLCEPISLAYWSLRYVHERLDHLVYEAELPL
jgi:hypothetical protein